MKLNEYKIGDTVELAFPGGWLQDSTRFPNVNQIYWIEGTVTEVKENACIVDCPTIYLDNILVIREVGIKLKNN